MRKTSKNDSRFRMCELVLQRRALLLRVHNKPVVVAVGHARHTPLLTDSMFSTWSTFVTQSMRMRLPSSSARIIVLDIFTQQDLARQKNTVASNSVVNFRHEQEVVHESHELEGFSTLPTYSKREFASRSRHCAHTVPVRCSRRLSVRALSHDHGATCVLQISSVDCDTVKVLVHITLLSLDGMLHLFVFRVCFMTSLRGQHRDCTCADTGGMRGRGGGKERDGE